ncbi:MAG: hypothetical protein IPP60_14915 [Sphingobacteriales bacterium]|nr:hypothetical protein [Sphingobacteriales bacterium]
MATFDAIYYQLDLNRYDLNKDGMFGGKEITNEQNEAMRKLTSDTGRNFSFITGFVFAFNYFDSSLYFWTSILKAEETMTTERKTTHNIKLALVVAHLEKQIINNKFSLKVDYGSC